MYRRPPISSTACFVFLAALLASVAPVTAQDPPGTDIYLATIIDTADGVTVGEELLRERFGSGPIATENAATLGVGTK